MGFQPGDRVFWLYEPRGGYGYVRPVPGVVRSVGKRIGIDVRRASGEVVRWYVTMERLAARNAADLIDEE